MDFAFGDRTLATQMWPEPAEGNYMTALLRRKMLRTTLGLVGAAAWSGCNSVAAPAGGTPSVPAPLGAAGAVPRVVGSVLVSTTGKAPRVGGVVYVEDAPRLPGVATTAAIDFDHKEFSPFISVVTTGGTVTFGNKDALTHHVFSPDLPGWDTGYLRKNDTATRTFDSPGAIALLCNIHPEMLGYLLVVPSTYFGKLGADGKYIIAGVPSGTFRVTAWAPRMPVTTQSVTVGPSGVVTANFEFHPADATN